jgi:trehalose/maltose hydrolase-like predicted phosphorylase
MKIKLLSIILLLLSVQVNCQNHEPLADSSWFIEVKNPENYIGIALANGRIGLTPSEIPFRINSIILNNIYEKESELGVSKIMEGINFGNLNITIDGEIVDLKSVTGWKQILNMKEAYLETSFVFRNKAAISYRTYALRGLPYMALTDINIKPLHKTIDISVSGVIHTPSDLIPGLSTFRVLKDNEIHMPLLQTNASGKFNRNKLTATATFIFSDENPELRHIKIDEFEHQLNFTKKVSQNSIFQFAWAGAICSSGDFADPQNESERMVIYLMRNNKNKALLQHKQMWEELWKGDIIVEGDKESQQDIRLALYHLYAFSAPNTGLSIPPMGLSSRIYNGHVFWDTELWMFPPLLVFNRQIAESLLDYRINRLEKARQKAYGYGYKGAMYPWESDDTGEEATPSWALTGTFEHHITADVGIALWNYFRVTHDTVWLRNKAYAVLVEIADFWVSRAEKNSDGSWSVNNVVGANEFAPNVDDNAFTNGSVITVLNCAIKAATVLGIDPGNTWNEVAGKLRISQMKNGATREHSEYSGEIIKQADVNLLSYPLEIIKDKDQIRLDLEFYEPRIAPEGPAMSHSIFSILYSKLGESEKAFSLFKRAYIPNRRPPFGALAETADFDNTYFATGAGGMLQAVIFGFAGLRLTDNGIIQDKPCLPPHWKSLTIKGAGPERSTYYIKNQ